jgi:hypothetical protein
MAPPRLTDPEIEALLEQAARYVEGQRKRFLGRAKPLMPSLSEAMRPFPPRQVLGLHGAIPIEVQAYEMEGRFALNPASAFSVEDK